MSGYLVASSKWQLVAWVVTVCLFGWLPEVLLLSSTLKFLK